MAIRAAFYQQDFIGKAVETTSWTLAAQRQFLRFGYFLFLEEFLPASYYIEANPAGGPKTLFADTLALQRYIYQQDPSAPCRLVLKGPGRAIALSDPLEFAEKYLRQWVRDQYQDRFREDDWARFVEELRDSLRNERHAIEAKGRLFQQFKSRFPDTVNLFEHLGREDVVTFAADSDHDVDSLLVQIASFSGHRTHPCPKMRVMGLDARGSERRALSLDELFAYGPEFAPDAPVVWIAVRESELTPSLSRRIPGTYRDYVARSFPEIFSQWQKAVRSHAHDPDDYLPVPLHGLQLGVVTRHFAQVIATAAILADRMPIVPMRPTVSVRTMFAVRDPRAPQVKTTVNMQMTSAIRTINPTRAFNAPVLSDLLQDVLAGDEELAQALRIVAEPVSVHWGPLVDHETPVYRDGYQLSAVFKANPADVTGRDEIRLPLNALLTESPASKERILIDVMRTAGVAGPEAAAAWFQAYANLVLTGDLATLVRYGIGLESHQQNIDMVFGPDGWPRASVYRDINGGLEIHAPLLAAAGWDISGRLHPVPRGIVQDLDVPLSQFLHCTIYSHLLPVVWIVSKVFSCPEERLVALIRAKILSILEDAPARFTGAPDSPVFTGALKQIRAALLERPCRSKRMLSMRILQTQDISYAQIPNPIAAPNARFVRNPDADTF